MKTSLACLALFLAAAVPSIAFTEISGIQLPATLNAETVLSFFVCAFVLLIAITDYSRRFRALPIPCRQSLARSATAYANVARTSAYGIRQAQRKRTLISA